MYFLIVLLLHDFRLIDDVRLQVPGTSGAQIVNPNSFDLDESFVYLLDLSERVVLVWRHDGQYHGIIGTPGNGPGELNLQGHSGPLGFVMANNQHVYVYDGGKNAILQYDQSGNFKGDFPFNFSGGVVDRMCITNEGAFLTLYKKFMSSQPSYELALWEPEASDLKILASEPDRTFKRVGSGGARFDYFPYVPKLTMSYDWTTGDLAFGSGEQPIVELLTNKLSQSSSFRFALIQRDVTSADKHEFGDQKWVQDMPFNFIYPKQMPYYNRLLVLKDYLLAFQQSPVAARISGHVIRRSDGAGAHWKTQFGEGGGLYQAKDKLLLIELDDEGSFLLRLVRPSFQ